jgi:MFS superfamily sulfate permease-like transporter
MADAALTRWMRDLNGAFGDLGTFLPYAVGAITVGGLGAVGVFSGFGVALIASGLFYGIPMAVQPMKAVSAALLTSGLTPGEVAMAGMMIGAVLMVLGVTGGIGWIARRIPNSVTLGLLLGLGLAMMWLGGGLMLEDPLSGAAALAFLAIALRVTRFPLLALAVVVLLAVPLITGPETSTLSGFVLTLPAFALPAWSDLPRAFELAVLPQIPLTVSNAIIVTAAVSASLFPERAQRVSERNLSISSGFGNLMLAPFGAMPMCHGAGGVVAQARFGARTAAAPVLFGALLLMTAFFAGETVAGLLAAFPIAVAGGLLVVAGADLAFSRRLVEIRPDCWPVIGITALIAAMFNPACALAAGIAMEIGRSTVAKVRHTH